MEFSPALAAYLGLTALLFMGQFFICGEEALDTSGSLFDVIGQFIGFTACTGGDATPLSITLFITVSLGWLIILGSFLIPVIAGLASNSIVGTIIAVATLVAFVTLITTFIL